MKLVRISERVACLDSKSIAEGQFQFFFVQARAIDLVWASTT
jgi:hypothetical protein